MAKTIGVLVIDLEGEYSKMLWPTISKTVQSRGHDCLILPANNPRYPYDFLYQYNHLFNFIRSDVIDVLILVPNTIMNFLKSGEALDMISRIKSNVPIVSMNHMIEGSPSLLINAGKGIREGVQHFVRHHGYKKIGYIQGPPENTENIQRKSAFIDAMKEEGISVADDWIFTGDYTRTAAMKLAKKYGRQWVENFDALFTANDYTSVGIISSLQKQGYNIPRDLAVIGFDNIEEAPYFNPPLSTVKQPFDKITEAAANTDVDLCEGKEVPMIAYFDTSLVRRASCGCEHFINTDLKKMWEPDFFNTVEPDLGSLCGQIADKDVCKRVTKSLNEIYSIISNDSPSINSVDNILDRLETIIDNEIFSYNKFHDWNSFITDFFSYCRLKDPTVINKWNEFFLAERIYMLISKKRELWSGNKQRRWKEQEYDKLQGLHQNMAPIQDLPELANMVTFLVDALGMENCFISLLDAGRKKRGLYSTLPEKSCLILAVRNNERDLDITVETPLLFPTMTLLPPALKPKTGGKVFTVSPLFSREEIYGFMINEIKNFTGVFTIGLSQQVSLVVQRSQLYKEREKAEEKLQLLLRELEKSNRELKKDSLRDELTGLFNRRGFMLEAESIVDANKDKHIGFCLCFADMDGLKSINDNFGHPEGDRAIIDTAELLKNVFREEDIIARLGGDEFTILSFDVPDDFNILIERRFADEIKKYHQHEKRVYSLSLSMGFATEYTDTKKIRLDEIIKIADDKLYSLRKESRYKSTQGEMEN